MNRFGWVIVGASFLALTTYGLFSSFGVFLKPLNEEFGWSRAQLSAAFALYMVVYTLCAPVMGWLLDRYGPRLPLVLASLLIGSGIALISRITSLGHLYLLFGVLAAAGHGAIYVVPTSTVVRWFTKQRGLAMGVATSGAGAGIFLVPLLSHRLSQDYGWRESFLVLGILFFLVNALSAAFLRNPPGWKGGNAHISAPGLTLRETLTTRAFWLLYLSIVLLVAADRMVIVHFVPFATDMGVPPERAAAALGLMGVGSVNGRLGLGFLSDRLGRKTTLLLCFGLETLGLLVLANSQSPVVLSLAMLALGFSYGGHVAVFSPLMGEFFGILHLGKIVGFAMTSGVGAGFLGPLLGGYIFDLTRSYYPAFLMGASFVAAAFFLAGLAQSPFPSLSRQPKAE